MTQDELKMIHEIQTPHGKWWIPFVWCFNLIKDARNEGHISDDYLLKTLFDEIQQYRGCVGTLYSYDWISIPLVYTQVTTLAVYTFFLGCVFGRQFLDPAQGYSGHDVDLYVPVFTLLQFFFYMGWLKVAEQMINPFGEDDDDFDMNWIIDRNMQLSLLTVDDLHQSYPKLQKDTFFDQPAPDYLAYTKSAVSSITQPWLGSTANFNISDEGMQVVTPPMDTIQEESSVPTRTNSHLNVNSGTASPIASPMQQRKHPPNQGHLHNNLIASLSGIRSALNLSRGQGDHGSKNTINIGYVQGIDSSRVNLSRLAHSSRDLNRNHVAHNTSAAQSDHQYVPVNGQQGVTSAHGTGNRDRDVRSLLLTLQGARAVSQQGGSGLASPMMDDPHPERYRLDSVTSYGSSLSAPRPRSHCFHVEPVNDSVLDVNTSNVPSATVSAGQNTCTAQDSGMTNASFVIDMNSTMDSDSGNAGNNTTSHHVGFSAVPQITPVPPEDHIVVPDPAPPVSASANQMPGELTVLEPVPEVNSDHNSSTESLQFIKPDRNQCTVTSLTPLLSRDSSDSEPEVETPSGGEKNTAIA